MIKRITIDLEAKAVIAYMEDTAKQYNIEVEQYESIVSFVEGKLSEEKANEEAVMLEEEGGE